MSDQIPNTMTVYAICKTFSNQNVCFSSHGTFANYISMLGHFNMLTLLCSQAKIKKKTKNFQHSFCMLCLALYKIVLTIKTKLEFHIIRTKVLSFNVTFPSYDISKGFNLLFEYNIPF